MATNVGTPPADAASTDSARRAAGASIAFAIAVALGVFGPILYYMMRHWQQAEEYSHGFLVAPLAIYFAWERKRDIRRAPIDPTWLGLVPLVLGWLALAVGRLGVELMSMRVAFVLTIHGLVLLLLGKRIYRILLFPLLFLFLMVPLPQSLVNVVAFPLQLIAADTAVEVIRWLGIPVFREGNIINLAKTQLFVAEACSGLRSLMALGTLAVVFAYFFRRSTIQRIVIVVSAIPIAILVNAFRVALTGVLTHHLGQSAAEGWIHQTEGFFTFALAFALLLAEAALMQRVWPEKKRRRRPRRVPA